MNCRLVLLSFILAGFLNSTGAAIDPQYHNNDEIYAEILAWQQLYPDTVRIDTIGYSHEDELPIWAVKISDNVHQDEDEPTVLFVGQVHAEELIGVEITLAMISDIMEHRFQYNPYPYAVWLQTLEIWIIPTLNPEGHQVVMDEWDVSFRKNKHDCNQNGIFDYSTQGVGNDSDGVDLNRNFPLNWVHGDPYLCSTGNEPFDYFRGFWPLSESETQALWELGERERFSFSIVWHSSRTGNYSEKVFYPWEWEDGKTPPDFEVIDSLGIQIAYTIPTLSGGNYYQPVPSGTAKGNQHDSFYAYFGTIGFLIEAGPGIQSPYATALEVISANLPGAYHLLNRACGYGEMNHSQLSGKVTDIQTGLPLPAIVTIPQLDSPFLKPRTCDATHGRYRRYVMPSTYDVEVRMRGYYPQTRTGIFANPSGPPPYYDFALTPKPVHHLSGEVQSLGGDPLPCTLFIFGEDVEDTILVSTDGQIEVDLPEGEYRLVFDNAECVVRNDVINLDQDLYLIFQLSPSAILFFDDFESGLEQWIADGTNPYLVRWGTEAADSLWPGGMVATESPDTTYLPEVENWIEIAEPLNLSEAATASVRFQHWYYFEPGYDYAQVEVSTDQGDNWEVTAGPYWGQDIGWGTGYASLNDYCGLDDVRLRWLISTDASMNEQGWRIDNVEVAASDTLVSDTPAVQLPREYALYSVYPNPFNSSLTILLNLPYDQVTNVTVWDVAGRQVAEIYQGNLRKGQHRFTWTVPASQSSGIYLLKIDGPEKSEIRKVIYLK